MTRRKGLQEDGDEVGAASLAPRKGPRPSTVTKSPQTKSTVPPAASKSGESVPYQDAGEGFITAPLAPQVTTAPGAFAVVGPDASSERSTVNLYDASEQAATSTDTHENTSGIQAVDAITSDEMAAQLRAQFRQEIQSDAVLAQVIQEEEPETFWTKRRLIVLGGISLLAIVGIVVGVVFATRTNEETYLEGAATISGMNIEDRFAEDIALSRDASTVAAVAKFGHYVQVFRSRQVIWSQIGQTLEQFEYDNDNFLAGSVELSRNGSILVVTRWNSRGSAQNLRAGMAQAYLYNQGNDVWEQLGQTLEGSSTDDHFGYSVALSDNDDGLTLAIGSRQGDPNGVNEAGYVRVFFYNGTIPETPGQWIQIGFDLTGSEAREQFGISVALAEHGRRIAVGSVGGTTRKGIVRVFDFDGDWKPVGQSIEGDVDEDDASNVEMSSTGSTLVIAAKGDEENASFKGYTRTFVLEGCCLWKQVGPDIVGSSSEIALSSDASCLLVGKQDSNDKTGGGKLLRWSGTDSQWKQIAVTRGDTVGDELGGSVAISENCSWFSLGANQDGIPKSPPGYVRIYQVEDG